jgi:hypothetical protein
VPTYVRTQEIEHEVGPRGVVSIGATDADIRIRGVDGDIARIRATYEIVATSDAGADETFRAVQLRVERGPGSLTAEEPKRHGGGRGLRGVLANLIDGDPLTEMSIEAEVPIACSLRADTVSGDMTATSLIGQQRYNTVSGDLLITAAGGEVTTNAVSGDVTLRADADLSLRTNSVSGDLSAVAPTFRSLRANAVSGDLELEGAFAAGGDHRIDTVSGDLHVGLVGGATIEVRGLSTDVASTLPHELKGRLDRRWMVIGDGASQITFNSMSGDVRVAGPRRRDAGPSANRPAPPTAASQASDLEVLQALERGEIDVEEATRRLSRSESPTNE